MFYGAKYFPIKDQIFEFNMIKWPSTRENIICGINDKFYVFLKNFLTCFYNSSLKRQKSTISNDNSFLFILISLLCLSSIHCFLIIAKFYNNKRQKDQNLPKNSNNSEKNKIDIIRTNSSTNMVNDFKDQKSSNNSKNVEDLKADTLVITRIHKRNSELILASDKVRSGSSIKAERNALYTNISETKIQSAQFLKSKESEKKLNQIDCKKFSHHLPLAIKNLNSKT